MNTASTIKFPVNPFDKGSPCLPTKREYIEFMLDANNMFVALQQVIDDTKSDAYGPEMLPCETALEESRFGCIELILDQYASLFCGARSAGRGATASPANENGYER